MLQLFCFTPEGSEFGAQADEVCPSVGRQGARAGVSAGTPCEIPFVTEIVDAGFHS